MMEILTHHIEGIISTNIYKMYGNIGYAFVALRDLWRHKYIILQYVTIF